MTNFMRRMLTFVVLLATLAPAGLTLSPLSAQSDLSAADCWQPGQLSVSGAQMTWSAPPATVIDPAKTYQATLQTTAGDIVIQLDPVNAPIATNNFVCLALAGYYSGTDFHRIFAGTLVQGGDPTATGLGSPGYTVPSDPTVGAYPSGSVAMANAAPDQNGSQFFVAIADLTGQIPDDYPVFGQVIRGMDVVQTISNGAVTANVSGEQSKPVDPSILLNVSILATGGQSGDPVGPVVTAATTTATAAAVPTAQPTPVPTTAGAQARPGSQTASTTGQTPDTGGSGCDGMEEYQTAFDDAYMNVALQNGDALAFLMSLQQSDSSQNMFEQMTTEQATAMSEFYYALADAIELITPPSFAVEWHAAQIEIFRALGEFTANIASQGLTIASMQASPVMVDLTGRSDAALASAIAVCADFQSWATGETEE
ncbi:MAG TPA: peptidylprolyl isomerase [Thermomicrobiales bacterium]|nr:peptidylprolyl isomerase [Thermomicrobiales bacterium]